MKRVFMKKMLIKKALKNVLPFWNVLSEKDRQMLIDSLELYYFEKGDSVYHMKNEETGLKVVVNGRIRVFLSTNEGNEITLYRIGMETVSIWSALSMINDCQNNINMEAEETSLICVIPERICGKLSNEYEEIRKFMQQIVEGHLKEIIQVVHGLAFVKISKRLADSLILYSKWNQSKELFITHEELANDIGTAREVVSRLLKKFEKLGLVLLERGKITIIDLGGLRQI